MKRLLAFGLIGPAVSWLTFCVLVLAITVLKDAQAGDRAWVQFIHLVVGDLSLGRVIATLPAVAGALVAMPLAARAQSASSPARGAPWNLMAVLFLAAPELLLAAFLLSGGAPVILAGLVSGALALLACNLVAGRPSEGGATQETASSPAPGVVRKQFGLRQD